MRTVARNATQAFHGHARPARGPRTAPHAAGRPQPDQPDALLAEPLPDERQAALRSDIEERRCDE
eukprot:11179508-Lingulodinium_polyedra.AAC.1